MPQIGQPLLSPFGKGTAGCEIRKFPSEPHRVSFAEVWAVPGGDGRSRTLQILWIWGVLQTHRAERSAEAGPACANHAVFNRFSPLLMGFISTLETRLVFVVSSYKGLYSSTGWLPPALIQECQL